MEFLQTQTAAKQKELLHFQKTLAKVQSEAAEQFSTGTREASPMHTVPSVA